MALTIYILSDSSGETAERVATAAASQFNHDLVTIHRWPRLKRVEEIRQWLDEISLPALVLYTLGVPEMKASLETEAREKGIVTCDILEPIISYISSTLKVPPTPEAGSIYKLNEEYYQRIDAINFAIDCDDGQDIKDLREADLVILGPSRSSKTPLSMYLAQHHGLKVANIPLVLGIRPPPEIYNLPREKVMGLMVKPDLLHRIRLKRAEKMRIPPNSDYIDPDRIVEELNYVKTIYAEIQCPTVDVSYKALEETASDILALLKERKEI